MAIQNVSVIGGIAQDLYTLANALPQKDQTLVAPGFQMSVGGKGSTIAVAIHRLTRSHNGFPSALFEQIDIVDVRLISAVGSDRLGLSLKADLERYGINTDGVQVIDMQTTAVNNMIIVPISGAKMTVTTPGAEFVLKGAEIFEGENPGEFATPDLIVCAVERNCEGVEKAIAIAAGAGIDVLLNPSSFCKFDMATYAMVTHLVITQWEASLLSGFNADESNSKPAMMKAAEHFRALGTKNVVITFSNNGVFYMNRDRCGYFDCVKPYRIADTDGAGEVFISHLLT